MQIFDDPGRHAEARIRVDDTRAVIGQVDERVQAVVGELQGPDFAAVSLRVEGVGVVGVGEHERDLAVRAGVEVLHKPREVGVREIDLAAFVVDARDGKHLLESQVPADCRRGRLVHGELQRGRHQIALPFGPPPGGV